jgi:hypothetical protein
MMPARALAFSRLPIVGSWNACFGVASTYSIFVFEHSAGISAKGRPPITRTDAQNAPLKRTSAPIHQTVFKRL